MSQINIGDLTIDKFYLGDSSDVKIYLGEIKLYPTDTPPTPTGSTCYEVISVPITSYTSTTYDSVYSWSDAKWYMLNNLNEYEEYGIYDVVENISSATTYKGKLAVVGTTEYQYIGGSWSVVGTYEDAQTTYEVTSDSTALQGEELATTFKIPYAEVSAAGWFSLRIRTADGGNLDISSYGYSYMDSASYNGTVTNDGEYYYYSLPSEAPSSVIIQQTSYWGSPLHLIFGSKQVSVQYAEKEMPLAKVYNTVADMEAVGCPTVGVGQYGVVGDNVYEFEDSEEWVNKAKNSLKLFAKYNDSNVNVIACNTSNELSSGETQPSYLSNNAMTDAYIGDCVTSIGTNAFYQCTSLTSATIGSGVTSIGGYVFYQCSGLTSITIPSRVTSIGIQAFTRCSGLTSVTIPNSVTSIGSFAFDNTPWWSTYSADTSHHYGNIIYINDVAYKATSTSITSCTFKEGTVGIGGNAFNGCSSLTSATIPNSVTSIGDSSFTNCRSLTSINIPSGVTSIGGYVFSQCSGLTSVTIGSGVTSIGNQAFYDCRRLTSVTIPSGVTTIGGAAFRDCSGLTSITIHAVDPPELGNSFVFYNTNDCPIYVPAESVSVYKAAKTWSEITTVNRIQAIPT